jgi:hypothetical protein
MLSSSWWDYPTSLSVQSKRRQHSSQLDRPMDTAARFADEFGTLSVGAKSGNAKKSR